MPLVEQFARAATAFCDVQAHVQAYGGIAACHLEIPSFCCNLHVLIFRYIPC